MEVERKKSSLFAQRVKEQKLNIDPTQPQVFSIEECKNIDLLEKTKSVISHTQPSKEQDKKLSSNELKIPPKIPPEFTSREYLEIDSETQKIIDEIPKASLKDVLELAKASYSKINSSTLQLPKNLDKILKKDEYQPMQKTQQQSSTYEYFSQIIFNNSGLMINATEKMIEESQNYFNLNVSNEFHTIIDLILLTQSENRLQKTFAVDKLAKIIDHNFSTLQDFTQDMNEKIYSTFFLMSTFIEMELFDSFLYNLGSAIHTQLIHILGTMNKILNCLYPESHFRFLIPIDCRNSSQQIISLCNNITNNEHIKILAQGNDPVLKIQSTELLQKVSQILYKNAPIQPEICKFIASPSLTFSHLKFNELIEYDEFFDTIHKYDIAPLACSYVLVINEKSIPALNVFLHNLSIMSLYIKKSHPNKQKKLLTIQNTICGMLRILCDEFPSKKELIQSLEAFLKCNAKSYMLLKIISKHDTDDIYAYIKLIAILEMFSCEDFQDCDEELVEKSIKEYLGKIDLKIFMDILQKGAGFEDTRAIFENFSFSSYGNNLFSKIIVLLANKELSNDDLLYLLWIDTIGCMPDHFKEIFQLKNNFLSKEYYIYPQFHGQSLVRHARDNFFASLINQFNSYSNQ